MTTRPVRIRTAAALAATALTVASVTLTSAASAAPSAHLRYVPITGNSEYLVYAAATRPKTLSPVTFDGSVSLYVLGRSGAPKLLGTAGALPRLISISGSSLVVANGQGKHRHVRWWDLSAGQHRDIVSSEDVVGAAPGGWLFEVAKENGTHVELQRHAGGLLDYGVPITSGVGYAVASGPNGFVAYANNFPTDNGEISYTPWAHPSRHRTLFAPGGSKHRCDSVSAAYAACVLDGEPGHPVALFPLSGQPPTTQGSVCPYATTAWRDRLAWIARDNKPDCATKRVGVMNLAGNVTHSKATFNTLSITSAFGKLVLASAGQRTLVTLRAIRAKPQPLKRAAI